MTITTFINFGIAAMTGLLLNVGSVGVSTMNQTVASDEAVESKGCATSFGKRTDLMFKYVGPDYTQVEVEDLDNWDYVDDEDIPENLCNDEAPDRACVIFVSENDVLGSSPNYQLDPNITLTSQAKLFSTTVYHIIGANNVTSFDFFNEKDL